MKNMTIGKRIVIGTGILCVLIAVVSVFAIVRILNLSRITASIVQDSMPGTIEAAQLNLLQAENQIRTGLMLSVKTAAERQALVAAMESNNEKMDENMTAYEATITQADDRANFDKYKQDRSAFRKHQEEFYKLVESDPAAASEYLVTGMMPAFEAFAKIGDVILKYNSDAAKAKGNTLATQVKSGIQILVITGICGLLAGAMGSLIIVKSIGTALRTIAAQIAEGADQTAAASSQVSAASQTLAEGASESAASLEETSASLEEMSSMTKRSAENARAAKETARETRSSAEDGSRQVQTLLTSMDGIKTASEDIKKILKDIDEIAFQTNILALNAAVEAARAGEAGAGFAVVADEVRNLAQRCAQAARETAVKIEDSVKKSHEGAAISSEVAASFSNIQNRINQLNELVAEIATASTEQDQGISQLNSAMSQMDQVTQANAASAEESASASEELNAQAETLKATVRQLNQLVGISSQSSSSGIIIAKPPLVRKSPGRAQRVIASTNGSRQNSHDPAPPLPARAGRNGPDSELIPMEGDFKSF